MQLNVFSYRKVNKSFHRRMVYHIGVDCGLFVEMNYMINAMLYCLSQRIRFCEEVHETFHKKYNFHRLPAWRRILKVCRQQKSLGPLVWKLKSFPKTMMGRLMAFWVYKAYVQFVQAVDCPKTDLASSLSLTIDVRAVISQRYLSHTGSVEV